MVESERSGFGYGVLAALFWSPVFRVVRGLMSEECAPLTVLFYLMFWAAATAFLILFLSGRLKELKVFERKEKHLLAVVLTGGYGTWLLLALALERTNTGSAHLLLYTAPVVIGLVSFFGPGRPRAAQVWALLLGFVGCVMMVHGTQEGGGPRTLAGNLMALGAAVCWGVFLMSVRPLVRRERILPVCAIVLGGGAAFLLATALSGGSSIFAITGRGLWLTMLTGAVGVAGSFALWMRCVSVSSAMFASHFWYLGMVFGLIWALLAGDYLGGWWAGGGAALIVLALYGATPRRPRSYADVSDIIRSAGRRGG